MHMQSTSISHHKQAQGFVALLLLFALTAIVGFFGLRLLDRPQQGEIPDSTAYERLTQVRDAIFTHVSVSNDTPGTILLTPDVRGEDNNYDGLSETGGCLYVGYTNGSGLDIFGNRQDNLRCIGKFPWRSHGLNFGTTSQGDTAGQIPWVMYSNNLTAAPLCMANRTPLYLGEIYSSQPGVRCEAGTPNIPFKWLFLHDRLGRLISDEIAFIVIMPGRPMPGQTRSDAEPLSALVGANEAQPYLDRLQVTGTNPLANPITVRNWNQLIAQPRFIAGTPRFKGGDTETSYAQPMGFNDRILAVSADEYYAMIEKYASQVMQKALAKYKQRYGYYPWAVSLSTPNTLTDNDLDNAGEVNATWGRLPYKDINDVLMDGLHPITKDEALAKQFDNLVFAGWLDYFYYSVGLGCSPASASPTPTCANSPKLTAGSQLNINALLIGPGRSLNKSAVNYPLAKAGPQKRITGLSLSVDWRDYLDGENTNPAAGQYESVSRPQAQNYNDRIYILP